MHYQDAQLALIIMLVCVIIVTVWVFWYSKD
jgi:cbb3-type cytochrome oxidase subunit 3